MLLKVSARIGLPVTLMNSSEINGISFINNDNLFSSSYYERKFIFKGISASIGTPVL